MADDKDNVLESLKDELPSNGDSIKPSTLDIVKNIFESFNLQDISDETAARVLDILFKHICDVFEEAKAFSIHANKKNIDIQDIKLAIECCSEELVLKPPHRKNLLNYAETLNNQPLPAIRQHLGLPIPPERYTLTATNYKLLEPVSNPNMTASVLPTPSVYRVTAPGSSTESVQILGPSTTGLSSSALPTPTLIRVQNPVSRTVNLRR